MTLTEEDLRLVLRWFAIALNEGQTDAADHELGARIEQVLGEDIE